MIVRGYPKISIVTPSYNQGMFLEETIKSVLGQKYPNLEYIIIDGCSKDNSVAIIKKYENMITYWTSEPDKGQADAINKGFLRSSGEIMAWLNSDDLLLPNSLNTIAKEFLKRPRIDVLYGDRFIIDSKTNIRAFTIARPIKGDSLNYFCTVPQETVFWRREMWKKLDFGLDDKLRFCMDYDFFIRLKLKKARFYHIPKFIGSYRFHPNAKNITLTDIWEKERGSIRKKYFGNARLREEIGLLPFFKKVFWFLKKRLLCWLLWTRIKSYFFSKLLRLPFREMLWN